MIPSSFRNAFSGSDGFTLIELMIVIAIIGILVTISVPNYLSFRKKTFNSSAESETANARIAMESYYTEHETYNTNLAGLQATEPGLATTPNVTFATVTGDTSGYTIMTYHMNGNKTYTATHLGVSIDH